MKVPMGHRELDMGSKYLTKLRESNDMMNDVNELRRRLDDDGYLLIRGLHDRNQVLDARRDILRILEQMGRIAPDSADLEGLIGKDNKSAFFGGGGPKFETDFPAVLDVVNSSAVMSFFDRLLGGESLTYDFKWPRAVAAGDNTGAHYDVVYMGRGTKNVYTMWTPLGDVPIEMGSLAICLGSQHFGKIKATYGEMDVDRDNVDGWFSNDPIEIVDRHGGQWATTDFQAGDVIIFGMFLMHSSVNNVTNRYRTSIDTRYQLASEPVDDRWNGREPKGHYAWGKGKMVPIKEARKKWGV